MKNYGHLLICSFFAASGLTAAEQTESELQERIRILETELQQARAALAAKQSSSPEKPGASANNGLPEPAERPLAPNLELPPDEPEDTKIRIGDFTLGGAMRVNWVLGDYDTDAGGPSRGGHGGDFEIDTFRVDLDYAHGDYFGKGQYRWYSGTNFFHTLEVGYSSDESAAWRAGLTRVPFGLGPYATGNSWFFDQHYYVGLADDMDLGVVYTRKSGSWTFDFAAFAASEPNMRGSSDAGARYSFDIVDARGDANYFGNRIPTGYSEAGQINLRAIRHFQDLAVPTDVGMSLQYGRLEGNGGFDDAYPMAASAHSVSSFGDWELKLQATYYDYDSEFDHITGGFFDFTTDIASKGSVLAAGLSYTWDEPVSWLDSITFYNDFSVIRKSAAGFNDSALNVLGTAISRGNWFIYVDWAYSNGNEFVGEFRPGMLSENRGRSWQSRFNINFGYYF